MFSVVIQAGGSSKRMGQDKGLLPFLGKPLVTRVLERIRPVADEVLVVTNRPDDYKFLGLPLYTDAIPQRGALGGLYTALKEARGSWVGVVACDMPFVNASLLAAEKELLICSITAAVIPLTQEGTEPFHAVYDRKACLPAVRSALDQGLWRVDSWFSQVDLRWMEPAEIARHDPQGLAFLNLNTPEDVTAAERLAERLAERRAADLDQTN